MKYMYPCTSKGSRTKRGVVSSIVTYFRDLNRFLEKFFERLETRNSILETRNSILETRNSILEPRNLKLEPRNSKLDSRKYRGSRIEFRVETVNLHLTGTVKKFR